VISWDVASGGAQALAIAGREGRRTTPLDAVSAIARVVAYNLLRWDEARFLKNSSGTPSIDYTRCRGRLDAGEGIGRDCILAFAPKGSFTDDQVRQALGILKDSGRMATIIACRCEKAP
jgi:hypothetical protein